MSTPILSREDYDRLVILGDTDNELPRAVRAKLVGREYPKTPGGAVAELRTRGLDVDGNTVYRAAIAGKFDAPSSEDGQTREWMPHHIDAAAEVFLREGRLTPKAAMCLHLGVDAGQLAEVEARAHLAFPGVQLDQLVMVVTPGLIGKRIPARVAFREPTDEESEALEVLIHQVQARS